MRLGISSVSILLKCILKTFSDTLSKGHFAPFLRFFLLGIYFLVAVSERSKNPHLKKHPSCLQSAFLFHFRIFLPICYIRFACHQLIRKTSLFANSCQTNGQLSGIINIARWQLPLPRLSFEKPFSRKSVAYFANSWVSLTPFSFIVHLNPIRW